MPRYTSKEQYEKLTSKLPGANKNIVEIYNIIKNVIYIVFSRIEKLLIGINNKPTIDYLREMYISKIYTIKSIKWFVDLIYVKPIVYVMGDTFDRISHSD